MRSEKPKKHEGIKEIVRELGGQMASKLESCAQSGDVVELMTEFTFKATETPSGGTTAASTSREKEDVLGKDSIEQHRRNCVWYVLEMLMYRDHTKWENRTFAIGGIWRNIANTNLRHRQITEQAVVRST